MIPPPDYLPVCFEHFCSGVQGLSIHSVVKMAYSPTILRGRTLKTFAPAWYRSAFSFVLLQGFRLTIRYDAIDAYSSFLVDAGLEVDDIVSAFASLLVNGVLELLPEGKDIFEAKYFDMNDGTTRFDTRKMMNCLVELGYAIRHEEKFA